eukprot:scaffold79907_cov34-Tisochrysis_lutea.AAC.1
MRPLSASPEAAGRLRLRMDHPRPLHPPQSFSRAFRALRCAHPFGAVPHRAGAPAMRGVPPPTPPCLLGVCEPFPRAFSLLTKRRAH